MHIKSYQYSKNCRQKIEEIHDKDVIFKVYLEYQL